MCVFDFDCVLTQGCDLDAQRNNSDIHQQNMNAYIVKFPSTCHCKAILPYHLVIVVGVTTPFQGTSTSGKHLGLSLSLLEQFFAMASDDKINS